MYRFFIMAFFGLWTLGTLSAENFVENSVLDTCQDNGEEGLGNEEETEIRKKKRGF